MGPVASSFDQECAAVMIARLATHRLLEEVRFFISLIIHSLLVMFFVGLIVLLFVYVRNSLIIVLMILILSVYHLNSLFSLNSCSIFVVLNSFSILIIHLMRVVMYFYSLLLIISIV